MNPKRVILHRLCRAGLLTLLWLGFASPSFAETTYQYVGEYFDNVSGSYSTADRVTGQLTTATPLTANLSYQDISGLVTSFSFSDGHTIITEADAGALFVLSFMASTDATGQIASWSINLFFPGSPLIQTTSSGASHNDAGQLDASNYGAIAGSPGTWFVGEPTVYRYTGEYFDNVAGAYTTSDRITGQFTTPTPLAVSLPYQDISAQVTSFSFSDGHSTITQLDASSLFVLSFMVSTDGTGQIASWSINLFFPGSPVIQTLSDGTNHNDAGQLDASNYGAIAGARGSWEIGAGLQVPAIGLAGRIAAAILLACTAGRAVRRRERAS